MTEIPGSKPKRLIKRTNFSNPSLLSNSIASLFNPEKVSPYQGMQKTQRQTSSLQKRAITPLKRSNSQQINSLDSLKEAESQFLQKKLSVGLIQPLADNTRNILGYKKVTQYRSTMGMSNIDYIKNFNYINHNSIKSKQRHGYNIINCMPSHKV